LSNFAGLKSFWIMPQAFLLETAFLSPIPDRALFCSVFCFALIQLISLDLGVISLLGLFTNILNFTTMQKNQPKLGLT